MQEVDGTRIPELKNIVSESLQLARKLGASQAESDVSLQKGLTTTVRLGEVETVEYQRDRGMGITVYFGQRKGSASTADLSLRAVAETVEKACDIARYTAEDNCSGLADPEELARDIPDLDLDHPWDLPPEQAVETARNVKPRDVPWMRASPIPKARA
jgi:PmbA protein